MSSERPAKRVRQACEPCRRKKSRCPGEKPICSHCARLRQNCYYADEVHERSERGFSAVTPTRQPRTSEPPASETRLEDRVKIIEAQLSDVLAGRTSVSRNKPTHTVNSPVSDLPTFQFSRPQISSRPLNDSLPPWETVSAVGQAFVLYCDSQPLPLFHQQSFLDTLGDRDPEIIFAVLALALRFTDDPGIRRSEDDIAGYVEASRTIISKKVFDGTIELSTIQSLCLLSLVDFTNGNTRRASIHSGLAMNLAHNAELTSEAYTHMNTIEKEERRRCFWSLFLLKRLHGADFGILDFTGEENFPYYPSTPDRPTDVDRHPPSSDQPSDEKGIMACVLQMSQVWFKITKYARRRGKPSNLPPWSSQSEYSTILAEQMDLETRMPYIHRFKPARFSQRSTEELHNNRDYWGPWLFLQLLYHTNLCLLNHPLLLSLRLRNFKSMIPEIFLQHTSDLISSHASWVIHIIEMLNSKSFKVTDPFLGYCVTIVATINLQESFVDDPERRKEKEANFNTCLNFVRGLGEQWPHLSRIAVKLQKLGETVSATYISTPTTLQTPSRRLLIDLSQFWEILEYSSASEVPGSARNLFGPSLYSGSRGFTTEMAQTSPLPEPTRVDKQDFAGSGRVSPVRNDEMGLGLGSGSVMEAGMEIPFVYSDDELAVLAESFFRQDQREGFEVGNNDWWNTGNL